MFQRRAGVRNQGSGYHVNLPLAWTELAQLAQCKGHIQEGRLLLLLLLLVVVLVVVVGFFMSQQHDSVSQGSICLDKCAYWHTEVEVADQTQYLI